MTRSSEVVMRLNGCDATDGMFDLVFSRPQGQPPPPNSHPPALHLPDSLRRYCHQYRCCGDCLCTMPMQYWRQPNVVYWYALWILECTLKHVHVCLSDAPAHLELVHACCEWCGKCDMVIRCGIQHVVTAEEGWVRSMIAAGATTLAPVLGRMVPNPAAGPKPPSASKGSTSSSKHLSCLQHCCTSFGRCFE